MSRASPDGPAHGGPGRFLLLGLVALMALAGCRAGSSPDGVVSEPPIPGVGALTKPPECEQAAGVCGHLFALSGQFVHGLLPGNNTVEGPTITVLPDGRLRQVERLVERSRRISTEAEIFADGLMGNGWVQLPGSELLRQAWERKDDQGTYRIYLEFIEGRPLEELYRELTIVAMIETVEPVVRRVAK